MINNYVEVDDRGIVINKIYSENGEIPIVTGAIVVPLPGEDFNTDELMWNGDSWIKNNDAYSKLRKQEYDQLNQWEMHFDDQLNGTTTWVDSINEIKERYPK